MHCARLVVPEIKWVDALKRVFFQELLDKLQLMQVINLRALLSFFFTYMNELEELALDSVATGGPKEVLTEQANNNPDIPKVDPVEPNPSPEKKSQTTKMQKLRSIDHWYRSRITRRTCKRNRASVNMWKARESHCCRVGYMRRSLTRRTYTIQASVVDAIPVES